MGYSDMSHEHCGDALSMLSTNCRQILFTMIKFQVCSEKSPSQAASKAWLASQWALCQKDEQNASLRKRGLNLTWSIAVWPVTFLTYKQFLTAIGSGEYHNVEYWSRYAVADLSAAF